MTDENMASMYARFHRSRYMAQNEGPFGPGSCFCCPDGGPYAGKKPPPKVLRDNSESRLKAREVADPELQALLEERA